MPFHIYPDPQISPLTLGALGAADDTSPFTSFAAHFSSGEVLPTMYIRIAMSEAGCGVASGSPPIVRLRIDTGDAKEVPAGSVIDIWNLPGDTGNEADATLIIDANQNPLVLQEVYLLKVFIPPPAIPGNFANWQIQIKNSNGTPRQFTWVVADSDAASQQPWIDVVDSTLTYAALTNQLPITKTVQVSNKGTGALTIAATAPGSGFSLPATLDPIQPNSCDDLPITFTPANLPAQINIPFVVSSNDPSPTVSADHNRQIMLQATVSKLELMLLLDDSGSMADKPDGSPAITESDSRWGKLKTAVGEFLDLLEFFGSGQGRFGIAVFPDNTVPLPSSALLQATTDISSAAISTAKAQLATRTPGGATPMGHGIARLMGELPDSFGEFESTPTARNLNRRWIILMTDGAHNSGPPTPQQFCPPPDGTAAPNTSFQDKQIKVAAIAYGNPGSAAVNHTLLNQLKTASGGEFFDTGELDTFGLNLQKTFRSTLIEGVDLELAADPGSGLTSLKPEVRHQVFIAPYDTKVAFVVNWATHQPNRLRMQLLTPNGEVITPQSAANNPNIKFYQGARYQICAIKQPYLQNTADPSKPRFGAWTLILTGSGLLPGQLERYEYDVMVESQCKLALSLDRTQYFTGDVMRVSANLTAQGKPIKHASVTLHLTAPGNALTNWLAQAKVTKEEMDQAAQAVTHKDLTPLAIKSHALQRKGLSFRALKRQNTLTLTDASNRGLYSATTAQLTVPGTYDLYVIAVGQFADGTPFRREKRLQVHVAVRPERKFTLVDINYRTVLQLNRPVLIADVKVFPRDRFGNVVLVDPDLDPSLLLTADKGQFITPLVSNLDGSYSRSLRYTTTTNPAIALQVARQNLITGYKLAPITQLKYVDKVLNFKPGREASKGINRHSDPRTIIGNIQQRPPGSFLALGAGGTITVGFEGQTIMASGDEEITVFVKAEKEPRPYRVEVLPVGRLDGWVTLGQSEGVTQSFSLRQTRLKAVQAIRIVDISQRIRDNELMMLMTPGVNLLGVGVKKTAQPPILSL